MRSSSTDLFNTGLFLVVLMIVVDKRFVLSNEAIIDFCAGGEHGCAIFESNRMKCWGNKSSLGMSTGGGLGASSSDIGDNLPFFNLGTSLYPVQVSCQFWGLCALLNTGDIKCVGWNEYAQVGLGVSKSITPIGAYNGYAGDALPTINIGTGLKVLHVECGQGHTCVIVTGNKVKCYGRNNSGESGYEHTNDIGDSPSHMGDNLPFVQLGSGIEIASIHSGQTAYHNCIILASPNPQRIKCWGRNSYSQLGYGPNIDFGGRKNSMGDHLPLVDLGAESRVKKLVMGSMYTCTMLVNDLVKCFGGNEYGEVSSGSLSAVSLTGNSLPSVQFDVRMKVKTLCGGGYHTCVVYDDDLTVKCAGFNRDGTLGQGDTLNRGNTPSTTYPNISPIKLGTGSLAIKEMYCGQNMNYIIYNDYSIKCFGSNFSGQCAVGHSDNIGTKASDMDANLKFTPLFYTISGPTTTKSPSTTPPTDSPTSVIIGAVFGVTIAFGFVFFILKKFKARYEVVQYESKRRICDESTINQNDRATLSTNGILVASTIPNSKLADENDHIPDAIPITPSALNA